MLKLLHNLSSTVLIAEISTLTINYRTLFNCSYYIVIKLGIHLTPATLTGPWFGLFGISLVFEDLDRE